MLIKWGHVLDSPQVMYLTLMCMKTACQLKSYDRGFVFSGVKVKAKHLRSQIDLLKIRPIPNKKGSPNGEPFLRLNYTTKPRYSFIMKKSLSKDFFTCFV